MKNCIIINEQAPNQVIVFDKEDRKTIEYPKQFLKRYFELGVVNLENPQRLYSGVI